MYKNKAEYIGNVADCIHTKNIKDINTRTSIELMISLLICRNVQ